MSFVGPRPLLVRYLPRYDKEQIHRHDVLPGLTGLAQVKGRNAITWEEKFAYDLEYVRNVSPVLDIKILFMTVSNVLKREGISPEGAATMDFFKGEE
jgi:lipopolysaccharide/colanic/teichoic acid biosynthesis glycosyltransferase